METKGRVFRNQQSVQCEDKTVRVPALASTLTCGVTERAALKQSTALSYSPLRLKRTPRPHCSWGSTWAGSELAACRNRDWTSVNRDLCRKNKKKGANRKRVRRRS